MLLLISPTFNTTKEVLSSIQDINADEEGEDIILQNLEFSQFIRTGIVL